MESHPLQSHVKVIAHRGNSSQAPENTLIAFQEAIQMNVDFIECDVQMSKDEVPIIMHDGTLHHIYADAPVHDVDSLLWEEIKHIDAGSWFDKKFSNQRVMSLEEFLMIPRGNVGAMVELKKETIYEQRLAKVVGDVLARIHSHTEKGHSPVLVGSLNADILLCLETYLPQQNFIAIVHTLDDFDAFLQIRATHYALHYSIATKDVVSWLQDQGKEVWSWTVDDKDTATDLINNGIQGIITNHPKKILHMSA